MQEEKREMRIGFIGFGNMAQAIAGGLIGSGACEGRQICACAGHFDKLKKKAGACGIHPKETAAEVAENSDLVVIAVKPDQVEPAIAPIRKALAEKIVVSIAAGYDFDRYEQFLASGTHHISAIPNTPVAVGEGIFICEEKHSLSAEDLETFRRIFGNFVPLGEGA